MERLMEDALKLHGLLPWIESDEDIINFMRKIPLDKSHLRNQLTLRYFLKRADSSIEDFEQQIEDDAREIVVVLPDTSYKIIKDRLGILGNIKNRKEVVIRQLLSEKYDLNKMLDEIEDNNYRKRKSYPLFDLEESTDETSIKIKIRKKEGSVEVISEVKQDKINCPKAESTARVLQPGISVSSTSTSHSEAILPDSTVTSSVPNDNKSASVFTPFLTNSGNHFEPDSWETMPYLRSSRNKKTFLDGDLANNNNNYDIFFSKPSTSKSCYPNNEESTICDIDLTCDSKLTPESGATSTSTKSVLNSKTSTITKNVTPANDLTVESDGATSTVIALNPEPSTTKDEFIPEFDLVGYLSEVSQVPVYRIKALCKKCNVDVTKRPDVNVLNALLTDLFDEVIEVEHESVKTSDSNNDTEEYDYSNLFDDGFDFGKDGDIMMIANDDSKNTVPLKQTADTDVQPTKKFKLKEPVLTLPSTSSDYTLPKSINLSPKKPLIKPAVLVNVADNNNTSTFIQPFTYKEKEKTQPDLQQMPVVINSQNNSDDLSNTLSTLEKNLQNLAEWGSKSNQARAKPLKIDLTQSPFKSDLAQPGPSKNNLVDVGHSKNDLANANYSGGNLVVADKVSDKVTLTALPQPSKKRCVDEKLVLRLIEMFPEASPEYIRNVCDGKQWSEFDDVVTVILSEDYPRRPQKIPSPVTEVDPEEQYEIVKQLLPDADPTYLRMQCEKFSNDPENLNHFIVKAKESQDYPTMKEYLRKQQLSAQQKQYTTEFSIENFIQLFPNPEKTFNDPERKLLPVDAYTMHYIDIFFQNKYDRLHKKTIVHVLNQNCYKIMAANDYLLEVVKKNELMKSRRKQVNLPDNIQNIPVLQELAYLSHKDEIDCYLLEKKQREQEEKLYAKENGLLMNCQCCYDDEVMPKDIFTCPNECTFCRDCIKKSCEVALGEGKTDYPCLANCNAEFSLQMLQNALPAKMFSKLAQKKTLAEIKAAGIPELETCPFCDFATIPNETDKIFRCLNPECMKESCRSCKEPNHIPLKCDEVEKDDAVKARVYIENKMTEALLRKCWKCGTSFFKEEGCNKMTCTCGAQMCYICKQPVKDYSHFNGIGGDKFHLCPLYSDTNKINRQNVIGAAKAAKAEVDSSKLKVDPTADIKQHYEERKKALPREAHMDLINNPNLHLGFHGFHHHHHHHHHLLHPNQPNLILNINRNMQVNR